MKLRCFWVEVMCRYSNSTEQMKRAQRTLALVGRTWQERIVTDVPAAYRISLRLDDKAIGQLMTDYRAGLTGRDLAVRYGLARSSVIDILRTRGVRVRHPRISTEDAALAVVLYQQGMRQIDIAEELGRSKSVIWHVLRRAGVL